MAYNHDLADRVRAALGGRPVREVSMFGGLAFMVDGRMAVGADAHGDLLLRCDPSRVDALLERDGAHWPSMRGRRMSKGWIVVEAARVDSDEILTSWLREALGHDGAGGDL